MFWVRFLKLKMKNLLTKRPSSSPTMKASVLISLILTEWRYNYFKSEHQLGKYQESELRVNFEVASHYEDRL